MTRPPTTVSLHAAASATTGGPSRMPPSLFSARSRAGGFAAAVLLLVLASFWSLDLQWAQFLSLEAARSMGRFGAEFFPPDTSPAFMH